MSDIVAKLREQIAPRTGDYMNDLLFTAAEEIELLRAERQWQPMETAPRDGTMVLMWTEWGVIIGFWGQRANRWLGSASSHTKDLEDVRHWLPLPKPPEQKS